MGIVLNSTHIYDYINILKNNKDCVANIDFFQRKFSEVSDPIQQFPRSISVIGIKK